MRRSIRKRLTLAFIGFAISPLLLAGVILAWQSYTTQRQQALNLQRQVAQRVAVQVEAFFQRQESELGLISRMQDLHRMAPDGRRLILSQQLSNQGIFEELILLDSQGQEQEDLTRLGLTSSTLGSRASADEFIIPQATSQVYYSPLHIDKTSGEPMMTIAVPFLDARTGLMEGVLVAVIRIKKIWDLIADIHVEPGQSVYILDAQGDVTAHRDPSLVLRGTHFNMPDRDGIHPGLTGSRVVLAVNNVRLGKQTFYVVAEQTLSEALAPAINSTIVIAVTILAALFSASGLGFIISQQIIHPIRAMAATAQAISAGDLLQQVRIARQDELGVLAGAFNSMTHQLQTLIHDLEEKVAEHRRVGEILKVNEERLRVALEGTSDGIWDWNLATGQVYFSPRCYMMMGYEPDEFPPTFESWRQLLHPDEAEIAEKGVLHAIEKCDSFAIEFRFKAKDGAWRWILGRGKVVQVDEEGKAVRVAGSHTDIAKRKQAEEEIRFLNEQLERRVAERTAQLEDANRELEAFSYSISHDLRAPLRAVNGFARILQEDYEPTLGSEGKRVCTVIRDEARRMGQLIDDLLAFSRLSRAEMQTAEINMTALVETVYQELMTTEDRERIDFQVTPLPSAMGDASLIHQVWTNLISNAIKFSSNRKQAIISFGAQQNDGEIIYSIRDNGVGYDMQYVNKLFGVFQRLHSQKEFKGTGVGLAIVQQIVHRHGGRVWTESVVDQGASFYFSLPRKE
jgi:PAS domain S-box-containing protein